MKGVEMKINFFAGTREFGTCPKPQPPKDSGKDRTKRGGLPSQKGKLSKICPRSRRRDERENNKEKRLLRWREEGMTYEETKV